MRPSSWSWWRRRAHGLDPCRIVVDPLDLAAQLLLDVGQLALRAAQPGGERGERRPAVERGERGADRVERRTLERLVRAGERLAVRDRVGEQRLLGLERDVLGRVVEPGRGDLLDLVAEQVDLAGPGTCVAAERGELGVERRAPRRERRGTRPGASSAGAPA